MCISTYNFYTDIFNSISLKLFSLFTFDPLKYKKNPSQNTNISVSLLHASDSDSRGSDVMCEDGSWKGGNAGYLPSLAYKIVLSTSIK